MKKIFLVVFLVVLFSFTKVYAKENDSTLTVEYPDKIYSYRYRAGILRSYGKLPRRYQNGKLVYCIESDRVINANVYNSTNDWSITGYSEDVKRQMELISYYGYGYPGHDSIKYYMATQELIWSFTDDYIKWVDEYSTDGSKGNIINIDNEKNEIMNLVRNHTLTPSFSNQSYSNYFGDELILTDQNNVINNYTVDTNLKYEINGSTIKFYLNKFGNNKVTFIRKKNLNRNTTVYYYIGDSQMMALFGMSDISTNINIYVDKVKVRINKKDINTKEIIKKSNATFKINNEEYKTKSGYIDLELQKGTYEIEEIKAPKEYVLNKEKPKIDINDNIELIDNIFNIDIYNEKPKGKIKIEKIDEEDNILKGVEIGLFDKNHNKISSIITNGNDYFDNLNLGTYYIKELDTLNGYMLDNKEYKVELKYQDDKTYTVEETLKLINKKIKCDIVYITGIKGIEINVYNENNKVVFKGRTNNDGKIVINNLPYGKYYIKQIKVPKGYILNEEEYVFYVNDSTCQSSINIHNEKTIMPITSTSINKCIVISSILLIIGLRNVKKSN